MDLKLLVVLFFFRAGASATGGELWKTDGTDAGTVIVKDINVGTSSGLSNSSSILSFETINNLLIFGADNGTDGRELWKTDGTDAGTVMIKDINPNGTANIGNLTIVGDNVFFVANDGTNGLELWVTDGTTAGTVIVKDINPNAANGITYFYQSAVVANQLFFGADNGTDGTELWVTDGTEIGTSLVQDINVTGNGSPEFLTNFGGELVFSVDNGPTNNGVELWSYNVPIILVDSIIVQGQAGVSTITTINGTLQMEANVYAAGATDKTYNWTVTNGSGSATIAANGILSALTDGTVTITATANDASGVIGSTVVTISNQSTVGIVKNNSALDVSIYPNPTSGKVTFKSISKIESIEIINITGKTIALFNNTNTFDISDLPEGIYFAKIITEGSSSVIQKLIKK